MNKLKIVNVLMVLFLIFFGILSASDIYDMFFHIEQYPFQGSNSYSLRYFSSLHYLFFAYTELMFVIAGMLLPFITKNLKYKLTIRGFFLSLTFLSIYIF